MNEPANEQYFHGIVEPSTHLLCLKLRYVLLMNSLLTAINKADIAAAKHRTALFLAATDEYVEAIRQACGPGIALESFINARRADYQAILDKYDQLLEKSGYTVREV